MLYKIVKITFVTSFILTTLNAAEEKKRNDSVRGALDSFAKVEKKDVNEADKFKDMFVKGTTIGQLQIEYTDAPKVGNAYATSIGGILKYELAQYHGVNAGVALYTAFDIESLSGEGTHRNNEVSSSKGNETEIGEAYLNYKYENFSFRAGRQVIDTPLADSDDVRIIPNSFEAYVGTYDYKGMEVMLGNLQAWYGTDAGLDNGWVKTGTNGTNFGGVSYSDGLEFDVCYYNITGMTNAAYFDVGIEYELSSNILLHGMLQYLNESELEQSGVAASIYGALAEVVVNDIGFNISINKSDKRRDKESFGGFGGGTLFTNMDTIGLDAITKDREAFAYVLGIVYSYNNFEFLYAYGDFNGEPDSMDDELHIVEQNIALGYNVNEKFVLGAMYVIEDDKIDSSNNWNRLQVTANYNF